MAERYREEASRIRLRAAKMTSDAIRRQMLELAHEYDLLAASIDRANPTARPSTTAAAASAPELLEMAKYRIRLLKEGEVVEIVEMDASDVGEIAHQATDLEARHGADDWEIVNGLGQ